MMVDGPGTIGLHPRGRNEMEGGRQQLFCVAMQSRPSGRRRKKADVGRCRIEIEATCSSPVFGQTRSIEIAVGVVWSAHQGHHIMAAIDQRFIAPRQRWLRFRWLPGKHAPHSQRQVGGFLHGHHEAKTDTARISAQVVCRNHRVWSGMEGAFLSGRGQSCLSVKLDDPLLSSSVRSMRAWPGWQTAMNWS